MTRKRLSQPPRRARAPAGLLGLVILAGAVAVSVGRPAVALETVDEGLTITDDTKAVDEEVPAGESVGEPAEDAPVDGEPAAGEAPDLPDEAAPAGADAMPPAEELDGQTKDAGKN